MIGYRPHPSLLGGSGGGSGAPAYDDTALRNRVIAGEEVNDRQDSNITSTQNLVGVLRVDVDELVETGGLQGPKGDKGETGSQGIQGPRGLQGVQGLQGTQGEVGPRGPAGADGPQGIQGPQGLQGPAGGKGDPGERGLPGLDGAKGDTGAKGADGSGLRILGTVAAVGDLPASGQAGDGWTVGTVLYTWSGSAWTAVADLRGPQGPDGSQGAQGPVGPAGGKGDPGERGEKGATGTAVIGTPSGGARVYHANVQNYAILSTWDSLKFDTVDRDTAAFWSASSPSRLTIPAGVSKVKLSAGVTVSTTNKIGANKFQLRKNGVVVAGLGTMTLDYGSTYSDIGDVLNSGIVSVQAGDYFELFYYSAESFDVVGGGQSWFEIEIVEVGGGNTALGFAIGDLVDVGLSTEPEQDAVLIYDRVSRRWRPGTPSVYVSAGPFARRPFKGALAGLSASKAIAGGLISWNAVQYDTDGFWSATRPSKLYIPAGKGIRLVRLHVSMLPETAAWDADMNLQIRKNQAAGRGLPSISVGKNTAYLGGGIHAVSAPVPCADEDQFDVLFYGGAASPRLAAACTFGVEVLAYADEIS